TLANNHLYVDNPSGGNTYTITVRLADDNMSANFTGGLNGVDFVEQKITVTVLNVTPTLQPITATDLTSGGNTTLDLTFSDPGADTYKVYVNWGDNNGF